MTERNVALSGRACLWTEIRGGEPVCVVRLLRKSFVHGGINLGGSFGFCMCMRVFFSKPGTYIDVASVTSKTILDHTTLIYHPLNYLMPQILNKQFIEEAENVKVLPDLRPGDIIELRMVRLVTALVCSFVFCFRVINI